MYTIINKSTGQEIQSHNMFRVSAPFPGVELAENEQIAFIPEDLVGTLQSAHECTIALDQEGTATAITVTKTEAAWQAEQPAQPYIPTLEERLAAAEAALNDLILGGGA